MLDETVEQSHPRGLWSLLATWLLMLAVVFALFQTFWLNESELQVGYAQAGQYDLRIDKELTSGWLVFSGDTVSYQTEITNIDEGAGYTASNVEVVDLLPEGLEYVNGSVSASVPSFTYSVNYNSSLRQLTLVFDFLWPDEFITITYDALVNNVDTATKKNVVTIRPEGGAPAESVPEASGFCTPGNDPIGGTNAVPGTNNTDCEQFTAQIVSNPPECGADDIAQNSGAVFYGSTVPSQLCDEGSPSVPQNTVEIGKWTWSCISWGDTVDCEALNPFCGDSTIDAGIPGETDETCDDGNTTDGDGCSALCQIEWCTNAAAYNYSSWAVVDDGSCIFCGDGIVQTVWESGGFVEECDDSNNMSNDSCSATCKDEIVRIVTVLPSSDRVTLENFGSEMVDMSTYRLSSLWSSSLLSSLSVASGALSLNPWATVTVDGLSFDDLDADVALFEPTGSLSDPDVLSDFVQWWSAGNGAESVADTKGIWTTGEFLDENAPFTYVGDGTTNGLSQWADVPSVCGNGVIEIAEICDDSNTTGWDGCAADCSAVESGYECLVEGAACTDINECGLGTDNCHIDATCSNTPGSFSCACDSGFTGDGVTTCDDIDECGLGTDNCSVDATCSNTIGAFACTCNFGFTGDGATCTDIDECASPMTNNCDSNATCTNDPGSFSCSCNSGYAGDGVTCAEICGDSVVTPGEQCDDGNSNAGDGCDASCDWEMPDCSMVVAPTSGSLALTVNASVQWLSGWELITGWTWWDGATEAPGTTTASHTYYASWMRTVRANLTHRDNGGITTACENYVEAATTCGDGNLEYGEECDDGASNGVACIASYASTCTYCSTSCRDTVVTGPNCGDGIIQVGNGEACDYGAWNNNGTCNAPYEGSCTACTATCQEVVFAGGVCGDTIVDVGYEQCDDGNSIEDDLCRSDCIRTIVDSASSSIGRDLLRNPRTERPLIHWSAPTLQPTIAKVSRFALPKDLRNIPIYAPGAFQYPTYSVNPMGEAEKLHFKRSLQALLQAIPQMQKNNVIGIDETLPEEEEIKVESEKSTVTGDNPTIKKNPDPIIEVATKKLEAAESGKETEEPEWSVTNTPRSELIELLRWLKKVK